MGQYDQMLAGLEAQYQVQRKKAEADAEAQLAKLRLQLQQKQQQAAEAESLAEAVESQTGADAWRSMLIAQNPFGARAERGQNGGLAEYYKGAAYDTYRTALRTALAKRQEEKQTNDKLLREAALSYALGEADAKRARDAAIGQLDAEYNLQRQTLLLEQAAYEEKQRQAAARRTRSRRQNGGRYAENKTDSRVGSQAAGAAGAIAQRNRKNSDMIDALLR